MKIVIDIDNETYGRIQALVNADYFEHDICGYSMQRIANGTPYEERPRGEWIRQGKGDDCRCSECGCSAMYFSQLDEDEQEVFGTLTTDWCPWCGADMRKETENEDS